VQESQELDVSWALWRLCPHSWGQKIWFTNKDIEQTNVCQREGMFLGLTSTDPEGRLCLSQVPEIVPQGQKVTVTINV
jgi:hypothetical protein